MLRDWKKEQNDRVAWIRETLGGMGVVYGNSGGKDCTLVGILCRMATDDVLGVIMPCQSSRNFGQDREDALLVARQFDIPTMEVDITPVKEMFLRTLGPAIAEQNAANVQKGTMNINPRLRMTTLYTIAQSRGALVCGTGNRSEATMGYFTKWGDGAHDFNPIADLTVTEIFDFLRFLGAPARIIDKAPSAGLFEGQTDEAEMGISYSAIDEYLLHGTGTPENIAKVERIRQLTQHKREMPKAYGSR